MERHIELVAGMNFRDLGGYATAVGGTTRWRTFFRADTMHLLTEADQKKLVEEYGIRTIIDLRRSGELAERPNVFAGSAALSYLHLNMIGDGDLESAPPPDEGAARIAWSYSTYIDQRQEAIREILATLATAEALPAMYHCAAGKDRTGVVSALLLGLAGVSGEIIAADYGLSAHYLADNFRRDQAAAGKDMEGFTWKDYQRQSCPPEAMRLTLAHIKQHYGGVESYMRQIGLTTDQVDFLRTAVLA